ncbi:MAG: cyclase/dehydrase [Acidobacteriales bacterium]|nr:cyclase/dehydrase [Terriglobales bacterium]
MEASMETTQRDMKRKDWRGIAVGALLGTGATLAAVYFANRRSGFDSHIVRLEDTIQIGRRFEDVYQAWTNLEDLPRHIEYINDVRVNGDTSYWEATVDGKEFKWKATTVQVIPNEAISWKSVTGPKHTGRISFSPIGDDTLVHVTMNYAPPLGRFGKMLSPVTEHLEGYIAKALRDFKRAMESQAKKGSGSEPARAEWRTEEPATGTTGRAAKSSSPGPVGDAAETSEKSTGKVETTRPPEAGYPTRRRDV